MTKYEDILKKTIYNISYRKLKKIKVFWSQKDIINTNNNTKVSSFDF